MNILKENRKFYFSVEGYTELWYLNWLQQQINKEVASKYTVTFDSKREKDPVSQESNLYQLPKKLLLPIYLISRVKKLFIRISFIGR